jgi:SAM-dependent methyltransferase
METITRDMVQACLSAFSWFREPAKQAYLSAALPRLVTTLSVMPRFPHPEQIRVLEIGGMPYFMTVLVKKFFGYQVEVANEPALEQGGDRNVQVLKSDDGEQHEISYKTLNIEYDRWPWEDETFDLILYCEVIEHLVYDPSHTLVEAHRVLKKPGGKLLISTPNALSYSYLLQMLRKQNFYPPYSGYSHYARHHRLFSPQELALLCREVGYEVDTCYSVYDEAYDHPPRWDGLVRALIGRGKMRDRLDVIYLLATPHGTARYAYPHTKPYLIYQDVEGYEHAVRASTHKSADIAPPALEGFFKLEPWGGGVRWTGPIGQVMLKPAGHKKVAITLYTGPTGRGPDVRGWLELQDFISGGKERQEFSLPSGIWETLVLPLPDGPPTDVILQIGVETTITPHELDSNLPDDRQLGVAVREVQLL